MAFRGHYEVYNALQIRLLLLINKLTAKKILNSQGLESLALKMESHRVTASYRYYYTRCPKKLCQAKIIGVPESAIFSFAFFHSFE